MYKQQVVAGVGKDILEGRRVKTAATWCCMIEQPCGF